MSPKLNRKLTKSVSADRYSSIISDDSSNQTTFNSDSIEEKQPLKREEFICSTAHNAHLQEDYLEDKSSLFGRPLPHVTSHATRHSRPGTLKHVSSERLLRKFGQPKALDTQSLRSLSHHDTSAFLSSVPEENCHERTSHLKKIDHAKTNGNLETKEFEGTNNSLPRKPSRKVRRSRRKKVTSEPISTLQQATSNTVVQNGECHALRDRDSEQFLEEPPEKPVRYRRLSRQDSVHRPLYCSSSTDTRKLVRRDTVTHQLSHHSDMAESLELEATPTTQGLTMPLIDNGRYKNPWPTWKAPSILNVLRWKLFEKDNSGLPDTKQLDEDLAVVPLDKEKIAVPPNVGIRITWLGHASTLVQFDGISVLTGKEEILHI